VSTALAVEVVGAGDFTAEAGTVSTSSSHTSSFFLIRVVEDDDLAVDEWSKELIVEVAK
jgi:hypothetical protein